MKNKIKYVFIQNTLIFNLALILEYLTNFNSNMALIVLINAGIYWKFTHYFKSRYVRD